MIVWDAETCKEIAVLRGHTGTIADLAFSPDSRRLASAGSDKTIIIWDLDAKREQLTFRGHTGAIGGLAFGPDGQRLASTSGDGTLRIWNTDPGTDNAERKK